MIQFKQMIECLRTSGLFQPDGPNQSLEEIHWKLIEECRPMVFHGFKMLETPQKEFQETSASDFISTLDAPFRVFSIERLDGPIYRDVVPSDEVEFEDGEGEGDHICEISCLLAVEKAPREFSFFVFYKYPTRQFVALSDDATSFDHTLLHHYLHMIHKGQLGYEDARAVVKVGSGNQKRIHRIRKIVHVAPSRAYPEQMEGTSKIDWSHRFEVRGHWRRVPGRLGKDRAGDYCINGETWVSDYVKGPEHLPLIKKTRIVDLPQERQHGS